MDIDIIDELKLLNRFVDPRPGMTIARAISEIEKYRAENKRLRMLLWLRHGCSALYGDDGEMQCGHCIIDFKRDTAESIEQKWYVAGYEVLKR